MHPRYALPIIYSRPLVIVYALYVVRIEKYAKIEDESD